MTCEVKNVLITSAGRRVTLVKSFQAALRVYSPSGIVCAIDMQPELSAACQVADVAGKAPRVTDPDYLPFLLEFCQLHQITLVVPTIDTELVILARAKEQFAGKGITLAVSSPEICETFNLKSTTHAFFAAHGFKTPQIIRELQSARYPLFAKLNDSSCSIGAQIVATPEQALALRKKNENYIFQTLIHGQEYTVDIFIDKTGKLVCAVPRQRLEVRAGEVSKALTCKDSAIMQEIKRLSASLQGAYGVLTVQLFKQQATITLIEINPRFGGGYPLSWHAGADFAKLLLADISGETLGYREAWRDRMLMLRYDGEVIVA